MCERHGDTIFVTCLNNIVVTDRTTSLCNIFYATLVSTLDVVTEWEEGITTQTNTCVLCNPCFLLLTCQRLRLLSEELLPNTILKNVFPFVRDIYVDGIVTVCTADLLLERQVHDFRALAQPPFVSLATSQTSTVDTALLTGTDTDSLSVLHIAYRVTLCIFQCDERYDEVTLSICREILVLCRNILEECRIV